MNAYTARSAFLTWSMMRHESMLCMTRCGLQERIRMDLLSQRLQRTLLKDRENLTEMRVSISLTIINTGENQLVQNSDLVYWRMKPLWADEQHSITGLLAYLQNRQTKNRTPSLWRVAIKGLVESLNVLYHLNVVKITMTFSLRDQNSPQ